MRAEPDNLPAPKVSGIAFWSDDGNTLMVTCPLCCHTEDIDGFDSAGADEDCLFCNECGAEFST